MPRRKVKVNHNGTRRKDDVVSVLLRMGKPYRDELDTLVAHNRRSRRIIVETLVREAFDELSSNPRAEITPL